jgi:hypothetical protein
MKTRKINKKKGGKLYEKREHRKKTQIQNYAK